MKYKQHIGLIPNVSYGDFVLGSNINMYLSQEHTKKMYDEATFSNISYFFKREEINVWCDTDGSINTIICSSYCLFHNKNLIGMKYTDFLTEFSKEPDSEDNIYVLVSGKGNGNMYTILRKMGCRFGFGEIESGQFSFTMQIYSL